MSAKSVASKKAKPKKSAKTDTPFDNTNSLSTDARGSKELYEYVEQRIQISEMRHRTMIEQSPLSVQILSPDGRTLQVNKAWEELWGATLDQLQDYNMLKDQQLVRLGIMPYIKKGFEGTATLIPAVRYEPDKSIPDMSEVPYRWVRAHIYPVKDENDTTREVVLVHEDITEQKKAEEALKKNEERFQALIDKSSDVIALSDNKGSYSYVSPGIKRVLGYTPKQFTKLNGFQVMHPDELEYIGEEFRKLLTNPGSTATIELRAKHKNGSWRWIESTATNLLDDHRISAIVSNFRDITERKQVEEELRESEFRFRNLADTAPLYIAMADETGNAVYFNKPWLKFTGKKLEEMLGLGWLSTLHPKDAPKFEADFKHAFEKRIPINKQYRFRRADGEFRWMLAVGAPRFTPENHFIGYNGTYTDVHELKMAQMATQESEERLRFMAESMPQKIFTAKPNGDVDYFNPQWMEFTGLSYEQIKDWGWKQFIHPDDVDENIRLWQHSVDTGEPFQFEHRFRGKDGEYRWHVSRAHAMRDKNGEITMWIGSNTDIEDIHRALERKDELEQVNAHLIEHRAQLVALNEAKDEFISLASHQLRTPAAGVKQYLGMLLEGYAGELTEDQKDYLRQAYEGNERQINIVNDLLQVAQVDAGKVFLEKEKVDLVGIIKSILLEQHTKFVQREQKVELNHKDKILPAEVDKNRIRMVIENIIDNASKYSPHKKTIKVSLSKSKNTITIAVKDQGVGIHKDDLSKIFNKFGRVANPLSVAVGGTGLGLYWVKKIIDLHDGSIEVKSVAGKGSTFYIKIPA